MPTNNEEVQARADRDVAAADRSGNEFEKSIESLLTGKEWIYSKSVLRRKNR
jgi:hypothetical protein